MILRVDGERYAQPAPGADSNNGIVLPQVPTVTENDDEVIVRMAGPRGTQAARRRISELATTGES